MLSKRFCFRKTQSVTSGVLHPCRIVSRFHRPTGFGGRYATQAMNIVNHIQYHRVLKELPLQGYVLDTGFGNENMLKRMLKKGCCSVYETEISESCVTAVEWKLLPGLQQGYLKLAMGNAESLPFANACMDTVYSINTIYFWEPLDRGLCEIVRILKPQDTLLLAFYDKRLMSHLPLHEYSFQLYDPKDVKAALRHNGYTSIEVREVKKEESYCIRAKRGNV